MRIRCAVAIITLFLSINYAAGQSATGAAGPTVNIPFFANLHDSPVAVIKPADVAVLDNHKPPLGVLTIKNRAEAPLALGLVIDTSNSERFNRIYLPAVRSISELLEQTLKRPDDKVFVEKFDKSPAATEFMKAQELAQFKTDLTPRGASALFDAVRYACDQRMNSAPANSFRVLILLSDGGDNMSNTPLQDAIASAQRTGTVIFAVATGASSMSEPGNRGNRILNDFAEKTGGMAFLDVNPKNLPKILNAIEKQIDNMHLLSYVPADPGRNDQYHSVKLHPISNGKLKFRAPAGYYLKTE
ncbi:MAG TPA: VWA domain-containing protein [Candidatus Angelobacter sp.]|nr:VWA domain-containing protein [Candidatus Angelobacter sp.]